MIFFPSGNKEKGIEQLETAALKSKYAAVESEFFLMTLYYQFENDFNKALKYAQKLHSKFPDNPVFHKYLGRIYVKKGNYKKAAQYFSDIEKKCERNFPGYSKFLNRESSYYLGVNYLNNDQVDSAKISFEKCVELSKILDQDNDEESGFRINATLYLGKIAFSLGQFGLSKSYYKKVLEMREYNNSHQKAERFLAKIDKK